MKTNLNLRGYAIVGLFNPKTPANVGSALRACSAYGASHCYFTGQRFRMDSFITDTAKSYRHVPLINVDDLFDVVPYDCVPVAVELLPEAKSLITYTHPKSAFYIFGQEDGTLDKQITDKCRDIIYIPTNICMNLAATVNVVLYDRLSKQLRKI